LEILIKNFLQLNSHNIDLDKVFDFANNNPISKIEVQLQSAPIKEVGVNGIQIDDLILVLRDILKSFNKNLECRENNIAITKLEEAYLWLLSRKMDREKRGVEGSNNK